MKGSFSDRIVDCVRRKGTCACVGIDPVWSRLPPVVRSRFPGGPDDPIQSAAAAMAFGREVIDAVAPQVGVVKINIAFFEPMGGVGIEAYFDLVRHARRSGLIVIGDVKRGDIGHSSRAYALAHLGRADSPDAITINPYFGTDGVAPFIEAAVQNHRGVFVLVHTSNPSAGEVQHLGAGGGDVSVGVAECVNRWAIGDERLGQYGYSAVGAVVAVDAPDRARRLRALMPHSIFLVPGFGAQQKSRDQIAPCFDSSGEGAIVNSSRQVIYAYEDKRYGKAGAAGRDVTWPEAVAAACGDFVRRLREWTSGCDDH